MQGGLLLFGINTRGYSPIWSVQRLAALRKKKDLNPSTRRDSAPKPKPFFPLFGACLFVQKDELSPVACRSTNFVIGGNKVKVASASFPLLFTRPSSTHQSRHWSVDKISP